MSESLEGLDLSGLQVGQANRRNRLTAPDRRAYDPSAAEISLLSQMTQPGASQLVGFLGGARADRQMAADQYDNNLSRINVVEQQLAQQAARDAEVQSQRRLVSSLVNANPESAPAYPLVNALTDAPGRELLGNISTARLAGREADALATSARGINALQDAGFTQPANAEVSRLGQVRAPFRNTGVSSGGSASTASSEPDFRQINAVTGRLETAQRAAVTQASRVLLERFGINPNARDIVPGVTSTVPGRAPLTPEQAAEANALRQQLIAESRARVLAAYPENIRTRFNAPAQAANPQPSAPVPAQPVARQDTPTASATLTVQSARAQGGVVGNGGTRLRMPDGTIYRVNPDGTLTR